MRDRLTDLKETDNPWGNNSNTPPSNTRNPNSTTNPTTTTTPSHVTKLASTSRSEPAPTVSPTMKKSHSTSTKPSSKSAKANELEMAAFFDRVAEIRDAIGVLKQSIAEVEEQHQKALTVISEDQSNVTAKEVEKMMEKTNKQASDIRIKLKVMEAGNKKLVAEKGDQDGDIRIKITQHGVLTKNFLDVMMEYKAIQQKYQEKYKQRMERQFLVVKPNATKEEIAQMMDTSSGPVFAQQIRTTGQKLEAKRALRDIQDRHQDIMRIERSILEMQQLFMDMAVLIDAQGEMLNAVEVNISSALKDTEAGTAAMSDAIKLQKKTRKKMCIILVILILIIVVIVLAVVLTKK